MSQGIPRYPEGFFHGHNIPEAVLNLAHQAVMMQRAATGALGAAVLRHESEGGIDRVAVQPKAELDTWIDRYLDAYAVREGQEIKVLRLNDEGAQLVYLRTLADLHTAIEQVAQTGRSS